MYQLSTNKWKNKLLVMSLYVFTHDIIIDKVDFCNYIKFSRSYVNIFYCALNFKKKI